MSTPTTTLKTAKRTEEGKRRSRRLRRSGQIPGVIYGHKEATVHLQCAHDDFWALVRRGVRVVDLQVQGKLEKCLIKEVQWDALGKEIVHVDFNRVSADERIRVHVAIVVRGTAPGIAAGGVLEQPMHNLEVECLAIAVPDGIRVSVQDLQLGHVIHVKDLNLPEGVKAFAEPEAIVVQVVQPKEDGAAPEVVEGPAEPEVIGRKAAEEAEEAE